MSRILIVGVSGLAGSHLTQLLAYERKGNLYGTFHTTLTAQARALFKHRIQLVRCDIGRSEDVRRVLSEVKPQEIYFLAGALGHSLEPACVERAFKTNTAGAAIFYDAVRTACPGARVVSVGSAESYGNVPARHLPVAEDVPLRPLNLYGLSKKIAEDIGHYYHHTFDLDIRFTRTFHYSGPLQSPAFVISDFARQVVEVERGRSSFVMVGNTNTRRDFTDVRDVVQAYVCLMQHGEAGAVYNVCSGVSVKIGDVLRMVISSSKVKIATKTDIARVRAFDVPIYQGDHSLLTRTTGWSPLISLEQTINDVLAYWRQARRKSFNTSMENQCPKM